MTNTSTTAAAPRRSFGQWALAAGLAILGVLAFVAAILYITGAANHIHFLSGASHHGIHDIRLAVAIVAGILLFAGAGYVARSSSKSLLARPGPGPAEARGLLAPRNASGSSFPFILRRASLPVAAVRAARLSSR
jgi:hypothetical protein